MSTAPDVRAEHDRSRPERNAPGAIARKPVPCATLAGVARAPQRPLHALAWTVWATAAAVCVHLAPSAVYTTVVLLVCTLVVDVWGRGALARAYAPFVGLAAAFGVVRVAITALTTHGTGTALFHIPLHFSLPDMLGGFTVGGSVERAVVLQSVSEAYTITVFVAVFAAWNAVVSHHDLLRSVPRAFHEPALVLTVAIAFVPATLATIAAVHEAERARTGGTARRRGALRRRALPVLEQGLERAISLAESMDSRGLGHTVADGAERVAAWTLLVAVAATASAIVALVSRADVTATLLVGVAIVFGVITVVAGSRAQRRTRYRPTRLTVIDVFVMTMALIAPVALWIASIRGDGSLHWSPTHLEVPSVHLALVAALITLAAPMAAARRRAVARPLVSEPAWTH